MVNNNRMQDLTDGNPVVKYFNINNRVYQLLGNHCHFPLSYFSIGMFFTDCFGGCRCLKINKW